MRIRFIILFLFSGVPLLAQKEFELKEGDTTYLMKEYYFCLLTRGDNNSYDSTQLAEIQKQHLNNIDKLASKGVIQLAGPFGDDTDWRGIFVINAKDLEEAKKYVETDPAIKAGRLKYEIHPWWTAKGSTLK